jgi:XTP/dITP diphosphohydrolase
MMNPNFPETILIATGNTGKLRELAEIFRTVPVEWTSLDDFPNAAEVEETGATFEENARLKAAGYALRTGLWTLADDSGLEVEALGGAPGVVSARYGGSETSFPEKIRLLLNEVERSGSASRTARFVCSMAVSDSRGHILFAAEGECRGTLADEPRGERGFGYDPIFVPEGHRMTFGELPDETKRAISHRRRAADKIIRYLLGFTGVPT